MLDYLDGKSVKFQFNSLLLFSMSDAQFKKLVRKALTNKDPKDIEIAATYGRRLGINDWDLLEILPFPVVATEIATKHDVVQEWSIGLDELEELGIIIDPNDPKVERSNTDRYYYPSRNFRYPLLPNTPTEQEYADYWSPKTHDYIILDNQIVLRDLGFGDKELVTDQKLIQELFAVIKQSSAIQRARTMLIDETVENSNFSEIEKELLRRILSIHIQYNRGQIEHQILGGIPIWLTGHNASCQFGAGLYNNQLYRYSFCDGDTEHRIEPVPDLSGYMGHFRRNPTINWNKVQRHWKNLDSNLWILHVFKNLDQLDRPARETDSKYPITRREMGIPKRRPSKELEEGKFDPGHDYLTPEEEESKNLENALDLIINLGRGTGMDPGEKDDANHAIEGLHKFVRKHQNDYKSFFQIVISDENSIENQLFECFSSYIEVLQELLGRSRLERIRKLAMEVNSDREALIETLKLDPNRPGAAFEYFPSDEIINLFFEDKPPPSLSQ